MSVTSLTDEQQELVLKWIPWARKLACEVAPRISKDERESQAYLGLCYAARGFKPEYGYHFTTYAYQAVVNRVRDLFFVPPAPEVKFLGYYDAAVPAVEEGPSASDKLFLNSLIAELPDRAQRMLKMRLSNCTYAEIGREHHLTRERIRQVLEEVYCQMRTHFCAEEGNHV